MKGTSYVASMILLLGGCEMTHAAQPSAAEMAERDRWLAATFPEIGLEAKETEAGLVVLTNHGLVLQNSWCGQPFRIGSNTYHQGLFCHAPSNLLVRLPAAGRMFRAAVGVQTNFMTSGGRGSVVFVVTAGDQERFRSEVMREGAAAVPVRVELGGATEFAIAVEDGGDGIACDQAAWADAQVTLEDGRTLWLGDLAILEGQEGVPYDHELPFSFTYDGRASGAQGQAGMPALLKRWGCERTQEQLDEHRLQHTLKYTDPQTGLEVRCVVVQYLDFPTVEWTLYFRNTGTEDTPILEDIQALDTTLQRYPTDQPTLGEFVLHHNRGDDLKVNNYEPLRTMLTPNETLRLTAQGGRPTQFVFPYFNVEWLSEGLIIVVGWPGQWAAEFSRDEGSGLRVRAGQELTRLRLSPGEEIRTPMVVMQFWKGDWIRAQNVWRAWMRAHSMPRPGGQMLQPQWNANMRGEVMDQADEQSQIVYIDRFVEEGLKIDYWWMDAGWYVGGSEHGWPYTGTWEVDRERFPRGLRAISDHAHSQGIKTIVWFEPERVVPGTWLYENHPEWLLGADGQQKLLNLGNPEAREWLTNHIDRMLKEEGIDLYRQDFNIDPLGYWRANDRPDCQGITENDYVSGYLAFWDELLHRNPELLIDSCASGGRRNDLETMRRSVPKHRSDYLFEPTSQQCFTYGLAFWLPFHGSGTLAIDPYAFWSDMAPSYTTAWDVARHDLPYDRLRQLASDFQQAAPHHLFGDYYPLTPYSTDDGTWLGWQFDWPEQGSGLVQMFRRPDSLFEVARCPLRGLEAEGRYRLRAARRAGMPVLRGTDEAWEMAGEEMMQKGVRIAVEERPGVVTIVYERVDSGHT